MGGGSHIVVAIGGVLRREVEREENRVSIKKRNNEGVFENDFA